MTPAATLLQPLAMAELSACVAVADEEEWQQLVSGRPDATLFAGPLVQGAHALAFGPAPTFLTARQGSRLVALWPLVVRPLAIAGATIHELGFARNAHTLRNSLLLPPDSPAPVLEAMLRATLSLPGWTTLALDNLPAATVPPDLICAAARAAGLVADPPSAGRRLLFADVSGDFDGFMGSRSGQFRRQLRKRERELQALGAVEISTHTGDGISVALPQWQAVTLASWQGETPATAALGAADWAFHRVLVQSGRLWLLRLNDRPVAALRMLEQGGIAYVHTMHFDRGLADHAPGLVLFAAMIRDAFDRGLSRVDFNGSSPFFARWSTGEVAHSSWRLYRPGIPGQAARLARRGLGLLRRYRNSSPVSEVSE